MQKASVFPNCWGHRIWARERNRENQENAGVLLEEDRRLFILSYNWLKLIISFPFLFPQRPCEDCHIARSRPCLDFLDLSFMSEKWTKPFLELSPFFLKSSLVDKVVASLPHYFSGLKLLVSCHEDPCCTRISYQPSKFYDSLILWLSLPMHET